MHTIASFFKGRKYLFAVAVFALTFGVWFSFGNTSSTEVSAASGDPIYMMIAGVEGESKDRGHEKEIDVLSWSWGMSNAGGKGTGSGAGAGKVSVHDISITKHVDKASPDLMLACASGKHYPELVLTMRKAGEKQEDFLKYTFSDVMCTSYQVGGTANDPLPTEEVSFNYSKVVVEYKEQRADGRLEAAEKAGWDFKANKAVSFPAPTPTPPPTNTDAQ